MNPNNENARNLDRPNSALAEVVERGLSLDASNSINRDAARYLKEQGVPFNVIVRVLREPTQRRSTTKRHT